MKFQIETEYRPCGDQPKAIAQLSEGVEKGLRSQVLLGITGSGKTFTMANVIEKVQRPTLVIAHNKTLAAQLYQEFKAFFPRQCRRVFRFLLRLLSAGSLYRQNRHLYRKRYGDQRPDRQDAPQRHPLFAGKRRCPHRRLRLLHLRLGFSRILPRL